MMSFLIMQLNGLSQKMRSL